jgi:hypothetical protein
MIYGLHAKSGVDTVIILSEIAQLMNSAPAGALHLITGDWNLRFCSGTPNRPETGFRPLSSLAASTEDNWTALQAFAGTRRLVPEAPANMLDSEQFSHIHGTFSAFTHIPRGLQQMRCSPSLIDWVLRSTDLDAETWCSWYDAPADHAFIITQVIVQRKRLPRRPKTTWRCQTLAAQWQPSGI